MYKRKVHPNTQTLLDAWRRMASHPGQVAYGPKASEYPSLIDRLFVLKRTNDNVWVFSTTGQALHELFGRELEGHDFLSLWSGNDRLIASATIEATALESEPSVIRAAGESLRGYRCDVEMPLAPLAGPSGLRMLGLYQSLGGEAMLRGHSIWKHRITSIHMPDKRSVEPRIKLVASND